MAELNASAGANRHKGMVRSKKLSTRVDLTPMVDLGFLLITFFVFTTTLNEPGTMSIVTPKDDLLNPIEYAESKVLTFIPIDNNKIVYYHGELQKAEKEKLFGETNYALKNGVGDLIRQKQRALEANGIDRKEMVLVVRPSEKCNYQNVIDILDEVTINALKYYSLTDLTEEEKKFLASKGF
jgi:biopolymer transport protein ExbD